MPQQTFVDLQLFEMCQHHRAVSANTHALRVFISLCVHTIGFSSTKPWGNSGTGVNEGVVCMSVLHGSLTRQHNDARVLSSKDLTGTIPKAISALTGLTVLYVVGMTWSGGEGVTGVYSLGLFLGGLVDAVYTRVRGAGLSCRSWAHINTLTPLHLCNACYSRNLGVNQISGTIPEAISALNGLTNLYVIGMTW